MKKAVLDVVCGSMFSGKTEELIRLLRRSILAKYKVQVFKHCLDNDRVQSGNLKSHNGSNIDAVPVSNSKQLKELLLPDTQVIGIDEVQFFSNDILDLIQELLLEKKHVIVAGLDLDFRGVPFSCMPALLALADNILKLKAICTKCGDEAHFSQRLINGEPAKFNDPIVLVGAEECYQARCRNCFKIDRPNVNIEIKSIIKPEKVHEI